MRFYQAESGIADAASGLTAEERAGLVAEAERLAVPARSAKARHDRATEVGTVARILAERFGPGVDLGADPASWAGPAGRFAERVATATGAQR